VWVFGLTMALANGLANSIPSMAVVSRWFHASRGKALGIAAIGTSVGGVLLPALVRWWLESAGWRTTLDYLALCVLGLMLPAVLLLVRSRPEDVGLAAEGGADLPREPGQGPGVGSVLRSRDFWSMGLSLGLTFAGYAAVLANLAPYAAYSGLGNDAGSALIIAVAVCGLTGKLLFGTMADRFNLKHGLWVAQGLAMSAFALFSTLPSYWLALMGACAMGLAAGGLLPVWGAMMARVFGLRSYGLAMGLMTPIITLCTLPTFVIVGRLVDATGSFQAPMQLFAGTTAAAALCLLALRVPAHQPGQ
jgi:predicted MFS family arabinose efflux permease